MKSRREERRQKVLDELPELDPAARQSRLEQAVAAGDVRSDEVESALRLVQRLEALSVFTVPPIGGRPEPATTSVYRPDRGPGEAAVSLELLAIGPGAVRAEAASRPVARNRATRKAVPAPHHSPPGAAWSSRARRSHRAAAGAAVLVQGEPAPDGSRGEDVPSIAWLRP
jgi:hypothetical protein